MSWHSLLSTVDTDLIQREQEQMVERIQSMLGGRSSFLSQLAQQLLLDTPGGHDLLFCSSAGSKLGLHRPGAASTLSEVRRGSLLAPPIMSPLLIPSPPSASTPTARRPSNFQTPSAQANSVAVAAAASAAEAHEKDTLAVHARGTGFTRRNRLQAASSPGDSNSEDSATSPPTAGSAAPSVPQRRASVFGGSRPGTARPAPILEIDPNAEAANTADGPLSIMSPDNRTVSPLLRASSISPSGSDSATPTPHNLLAPLRSGGSATSLHSGTSNASIGSGAASVSSRFMQRRTSISQASAGSDMTGSSTASLSLSHANSTAGSRPMTGRRSSVFAMRRASLVAEAAAAVAHSATASAASMSLIPNEDSDYSRPTSAQHRPIIPGLQTSGSASRLLDGIHAIKDDDENGDRDSNSDRSDSERDGVESDTETVPSSQMRRVETWGDVSVQSASQ